MIINEIDVEVELEAHIEFEAYTERKNKFNAYTKDIARLTSSVEREQKRLTKAQKDLDATLEHKCYACGQEIHDEKHEQILETKTSAVAEYEEQISMSMMQK